MARAYAVRHGTPATLVLPPAATLGSRPAVALAAFRRTLAAIRLMTFWNLQVCFYRAYAAAMAGRELGLNVQLHMGVRSLTSTTHGAHSWISIRGVVVGERRPPRSIYPVQLGRTSNVTYWMATPASGKCPIVPPASAPPTSGPGQDH
jgi:hypothetical protein